MEQPKSVTSRRTVIVIAIAAMGGIALVIALMVMNARNASRPQLDVTNTGAAVVSARLGNDESVIQPTQTLALRYSVGDSLTFSVPTDGKSKTVVLDRAGRGGGNQPVKFKAEVNADGNDIQFRFTDRQ